MAFDFLNLRNPVTGETKRVPVGFSWTTFFFGPFVALFRADWLMLIVILLLAIFTWGISNIVFAFIYNKVYAKNLLIKGGYKINSVEKGSIESISSNIGLDLSLYKM